MTPLCFSLAAACGSREHTVVQKIPAFQRQREGSFRAWLRVVTVNRAGGKMDQIARVIVKQAGAEQTPPFRVRAQLTKSEVVASQA